MRQLISASILSADFANLGDQIRQAEDAGVDWIHVDVMDGRFVPNITMGPFIVETCRRITSLPLDVHLMILEPERYITDFSNAGANNLTVHIENNPNSHRTLQKIRALGVHPGIVLNPGTPAESVFQVLNLVDLVLVMSVNPGYSGQSFIPEMVQKVKELRQELDRIHPEAMVEIDGGITPDHLIAAAEAGAEAFVAATAIFKHMQGISAGVKSLRGAFPV